MVYRLSGHCQLDGSSDKRATRKEALRYDEESGRAYKVYDGHIDEARTSWNRVLIQRDVNDVYKERLSVAVDEYNAKQLANGRRSRCTTVEQEMQKIVDGEKKGNAASRPKLWFSCVTQCGSMSDNPAWDVVDGKRVQPELAKMVNDVYVDFLNRFQTRYPNLEVTLAVIHNDEGVPHLQYHYVGFCSSNKKGLRVQVKLCDSLAEALDRVGVRYGRKQFDNVKEAFNDDVDALLAETMREHGIEWIPPEKEDRSHMTDEERRKAKKSRRSIQEMRRDTRLISECIEKGVKEGTITLDTIDKIRIPGVGSFYREKDVRGLVEEMSKRNALLEKYYDDSKELERRDEAVLHDRRKRLDASYGERKALLEEREREASRVLRDVLIMKEKLQDQDQQRRYERLAGELEKKTVEADKVRGMGMNAYTQALKEVKAMKEKAQAEAKAITDKGKAEAERLMKAAEAARKKDNIKLMLLKERFPKVDAALDKEIKKAGKVKLKQEGHMEDKGIDNS